MNKYSLLVFFIFVYGCINAKTNKKLKTESDGFEWYEITTNDMKYGAASINGKVIIRPEYDMLFYYNGRFKVAKNMYYGYFLKDGKCIIPISRKYRGDLFWHKMTISTTGEEYDFLKIISPKYTIICNQYGKEILRTQRYKNITPYYVKDHFFYVVKDAFGKYGVLDGNGEIVIPVECCNSIYVRGNQLVTKDCFDDTYVNLAPLSSISTTSNDLIK